MVVGARRPPLSRFLPELVTPVADVCDRLVSAGLGAGAGDVPKAASVLGHAVVQLAVMAEPRDVASLAAGLTYLLLLLALAGNMAPLAAVLEGHFVRSVLAVLGDVAHGLQLYHSRDSGQCTVKCPLL
ncbi:hypothetical protein HPB48_020350 [Haemaphysalis longicornis]|uniref:Uncharacterized protein n=1 Tax=Haemaphysalis longicornis TaxID=44386 RepID=A0A9J6GTD9_HAELO|nr:hypothetical protein HPB48_020350 [Haemaphysalis longicornis]